MTVYAVYLLVMAVGICMQEKQPFRRMVVGIPGNDGLYLIEICCPEDCFQNHQVRMKAILDSVRIGV